MPSRLSVRGVAEVAGVTPPTARYHHSIGVLPDPPPGGSGYRRYGGKEAIELVHARALGMPLPQDLTEALHGQGTQQRFTHQLRAYVQGTR